MEQRYHHRRGIFAGLDIGDFYLEIPMDEYEYTTMTPMLFPQKTVKQYQLNKNAHNGQVYLESQRTIYGLLQAGALSNKQLNKFLAPAGYYKVALRPGLRRHTT